MQRRNFLKSIGLLTAVSAVPVYSSAAGISRTEGKTIISGKVADGGKGISGVLVSDGYNIVQTGARGEYSFMAHDLADHVFLTLPSGYAIPNEKGIARFYQRIDKHKAAQTADFPLLKLKQDDNRHAFILWGDTQIIDKEDAEKLIKIAAPDTRDQIKALGDIPIHGIGCGDLVFDHLELFEDYKKAVELTGAPFFQLIGNHDMDLQARTDDLSQESFKAQFGPTYFSFNRGKIHYVILDNVFFLGAGAGYMGYITENQLSWLEKDLKHVKEGSTVIVSLHIPTNDATMGHKNPKEGMSNREALYTLLKPYKAHILSGHTHYNENWEDGNIMEHNHGTVCGAWWSGPVCGDGTPSGYGVYEVDGDNLKWFYKSTGFAKEHQLKIYKKGEFLKKPEAIMANVYNWDGKWKVEWMEDGVLKGNMAQVNGLDPLAVQLYEGKQLPSKHTWVEPVYTDHLFTAVPSSTAKKITVKVTDRFGKVYEEQIVLS